MNLFEQPNVEVDRYYIRCTDCLSMGVVEGVTPKCDRLKWGQKWATILEWTCGICGGQLELMGKVTKDDKHIEREEERTPCDRRCTHAIGPLCVCKCGCANHGTGRVVTFKVLEDKPIIDFKAEENALSNLEAFRREVQRAQEVIASKPKGFVPYPVYQQFNQFKKELGIALAARKHETRMKHLAKVML